MPSSSTMLFCNEFFHIPLGSKLQRPYKFQGLRSSQVLCSKSNSVTKCTQTTKHIFFLFQYIMHTIIMTYIPIPGSFVVDSLKTMQVENMSKAVTSVQLTLLEINSLCRWCFNIGHVPKYVSITTRWKFPLSIQPFSCSKRTMFPFSVKDHVLHGINILYHFYKVKSPADIGLHVLFTQFTATYILCLITLAPVLSKEWAAQSNNPN